MYCNLTQKNKAIARAQTEAHSLAELGYTTPEIMHRMAGVRFSDLGVKGGSIEYLGQSK